VEAFVDFGTFTLPGGREVFLCNFHVEATYNDFPASNLVEVSPVILARVPARVRAIMPPGEPLVVLPPADPPLGSFRFTAEFESSPGARSSERGVGSRLYLCWFGNELAASVHDMAWEALGEVEWEAVAADFHIGEGTG